MLVFNRFAGEWEVVEDEENRAALVFWRRVISPRRPAAAIARRAMAAKSARRFRTSGAVVSRRYA